MAKSRMSSAPRKPHHPQGFMTSLASAFLEWLLMFLLFSNALFSYLITKFARYCNLPLPCILCSRLDNVLGKQKVEYFHDLICGKHKSEISSLVLCHAHCKLVDVHKMCETCLFSFATINKSNSETYRLLVGKLGDDPEGEFEEGQLIEGEKQVNNTRRCCCCNELWRPKGYPHNLLRTCSVDHEASHLDTQLPLDIGRDSCQHKQRSRKEVEVRDDSHMYHVGYTELKVTSDTESEVMISEHELNITHYDINDHKLDEPMLKIITLVDDSVSEKLIHPSSETGSSELVAHPQPDNITASSMASDSNVSMHGLEELNWHHVELKAHSYSQTELISFDDPPSQDVRETVVEDMKESDDCTESSKVKQTSLANVEEGPKEMIEAVSDSLPELKKDTYLQSSKSLDFGDAYNIANVEEGPKETVEAVTDSQPELEKDTDLQLSKSLSFGDAYNIANVEEGPKETVEAVTDSLPELKKDTDLQSSKSLGFGDAYNIANVEEGPTEMIEAVSDSQPEQKMDTDLQSSKSLDFGDAYNIAISNKGRPTSGSFGECTVNNSAKISEDLKQLLSQISRGTDLPSFDMSPRVSRNLEELKHLDSSSTGMQMLQKRISLERNESGLESLDGSVSEVEGESLVDRLKRQIEHDKKLLLTLYKELEEERSASAIAANQTMAMITRLQEEKAALHMDASQYLRMMEEQAEYDMEALQNCNDLLSERDIEIQALEAELEHYRSKYPDEAMLLAKLMPSYDSTEKDTRVDQPEARPFEDRSFSRNISIPKNVEGLRTSFRDQMKSSFLERENEKTFVSDFSNKLKELSENEADSSNDNDSYFMHREETELCIEELNNVEDLKNGGELDMTAYSNKKEGSMCKENLHAAENTENDVVSSEKQASVLDVNHEATATGKSSPNSPGNQHKGWHIVQEIDLEEDKGKDVEC